MIYRSIAYAFPQMRLALVSKSDVIAPVIISSSVTLLGFLAALITILFGITDGQHFSRFKKKRYLEVLLNVYLCAILVLIFSCIFAFMAFSEYHSSILFPAMIITALSGYSQVAIVTLIILNLVRKAFKHSLDDISI